MWLGAILLAVLGANVNDPYMVPVEPWAAYAITALGLGGLMLSQKRRGGAARRLLLLLLWCAVPLSVGVAEAAFQWRKHGVLAVEPRRAQALGRHFMVGYRRYEEVAPLVERGLVGGIFVTRRNLAGRTARDLADEIARLQDLRKAAGLPPLLVATDQEGGAVAHLSPAVAALPPLASLAALPAEERDAAARAYGARHGRELAALGVTVNFAPVLDVWRPRAPSRLDFNTRIHQRTISDDPAVVGAVGQAYAAGLAQAGVRPTVKHFPGMGRVTDDTHHFRASLATAKDELEATDWRPFRQVLAGSDNLLMVGHVTLAAIDPDRPASHSRRVIDGLLRREWGFDGVIITDDLVMSAIYQHGLCRAVEDALNAGVDLLLVAFDGKQYFRAMACALSAGPDPAMLARSDRRLQRLVR